MDFHPKPSLRFTADSAPPIIHPASAGSGRAGLCEASAPFSGESQIPMLCIGEQGPPGRTETGGIELLPGAGIS